VGVGVKVVPVGHDRYMCCTADCPRRGARRVETDDGGWFGHSACDFDTHLQRVVIDFERVARG